MGKKYLLLYGAPFTHIITITHEDSHIILKCSRVLWPTAYSTGNYFASEGFISEFDMPAASALTPLYAQKWSWEIYRQLQFEHLNLFFF